tara:strand:- start:2000 stop:3631 length:1632 start_codon:yes stop_codon:yes gene_type:complete
MAVTKRTYTLSGSVTPATCLSTFQTMFADMGWFAEQETSGELDSVSITTYTSFTDTNQGYEYYYIRDNEFTTSGSGTGAAISIARHDGQVRNFKVNSYAGTATGSETTWSGLTSCVSRGGTGYAVGDTITIPGSKVGGSDTTDDIVLTITSVNSHDGGNTWFDTYADTNTNYKHNYGCLKTVNDSTKFWGTTFWTFKFFQPDTTGDPAYIQFQWYPATSHHQKFDNRTNPVIRGHFGDRTMLANDDGWNKWGDGSDHGGNENDTKDGGGWRIVKFWNSGQTTTINTYQSGLRPKFAVIELDMGTTGKMLLILNREAENDQYPRSLDNFWQNDCYAFWYVKTYEMQNNFNEFHHFAGYMLSQNANSVTGGFCKASQGQENNNTMIADINGNFNEPNIFNFDKGIATIYGNPGRGESDANDHREYDSVQIDNTGNRNWFSNDSRAYNDDWQWPMSRINDINSPTIISGPPVSPVTYPHHFCFPKDFGWLGTWKFVREGDTIKISDTNKWVPLLARSNTSNWGAGYGSDDISPTKRYSFALAYRSV